MGTLTLSLPALVGTEETRRVQSEQEPDPRLRTVVGTSAVLSSLGMAEAEEQGRGDFSGMIPFTIQVNDRRVPWYSLAERARIENFSAVATKEGPRVQGHMKYPLSLVHRHPFVAVRNLAELMGGQVDYFDKKVLITATRGYPYALRFSINSNVAWANKIYGSQTDTTFSSGAEKVELPCPTYLEENHLMVPLQFLVEALGHTYHYDEKAKLVAITRSW